MARRPYSKRIPLNLMFVDPRYQRDLNEERVGRLSRNYDPRRADGFVVSLRKTGRYAVLDGQHRLEMLRDVGEKDVISIVHEGLSDREEAELFDLLNTDRVRPSAISIFKARVFRGAEPETTINSVVEDHGFTVLTNTRPKQIRAISGLERAYARGNLSETLDILGLWPSDWEERLRAEIVGGVSLFLHRFSAEVDQKRLHTLLKRTHPSLICAEANAIRKTSGNSVSRENSARVVLMNLYNKRLGNERRLRLADPFVDEAEDEAAEAV